MDKSEPSTLTAEKDLLEIKSESESDNTVQLTMNMSIADTVRQSHDESQREMLAGEVIENVLSVSGLGDKIMIVDDQVFNIEAMKINLKLKGIQEFFEDEDESDAGQKKKPKKTAEKTSSYMASLLRIADKTEGSMTTKNTRPATSDISPAFKNNRGGQSLMEIEDDLRRKRIHSIQSGASAIALVKQLWEEEHKLFRIIFMDCQMPNMDGFECSQKITQLVAEWK